MIRDGLRKNENFYTIEYVWVESAIKRSVGNSKELVNLFDNFKEEKFI